MSTAIETKNLGKCYRLNRRQGDRYHSLRDTIQAGAQGFWQRLSSARNLPPAEASTEEFWAIRELELQISHGERVGVIGRNGAGKSTLLKLLSRITAPSTGKFAIYGRVASLLEVGTGFHPELTGRENIFLNGAILGMGRLETQRKFDEIVDFAGVERFLDTPVKRYSSGMYVRLAFAVAAHLEPDVLIVDEVLAVGDAEFQRRCMGKMSEVSRDGRTVLFVSHNMAAVQSLCSRAILLESGRVVHDSDVNSTILAYSRQNTSSELVFARREIQNGLWLEDLRIRRNHEGRLLGLDFAFSDSRAGHVREFSLLVYSAHGVRIGIIDARDSIVFPKPYVRNFSIQVAADALPLVEGTYSIGFYVVTDIHSTNALDVYSLDFLDSARRGPHAPYRPEARGLVSLHAECRFESDFPT